MRQSAPLYRTEAAPDGPETVAPTVHGITERLELTGTRHYHVEKMCRVCGFPLINGELRTHRGRCARWWKTRLQRERRRRG